MSTESRAVSVFSFLPFCVQSDNALAAHALDERVTFKARQTVLLTPSDCFWLKSVPKVLFLSLKKTSADPTDVFNRDKVWAFEMRTL